MERFYDRLQKVDPGVVALDAENRIVGMNGEALRLLGDIRGDPLGREVLQSSLLRHVLLVKTSRLLGRESGDGSCVVFFDLSRVGGGAEEVPPRRLLKVPVQSQNRVLLLATEEVVWLQSEAHYTKVHTREREYLCNLSLSDLEERLDPARFLRVHRSYVIHLVHAHTVERVGDGCVVAMDAHDAPRIAVSRSRLPALKAALGLALTPALAASAEPGNKRTSHA